MTKTHISSQNRRPRRSNSSKKKPRFIPNPGICKTSTPDDGAQLSRSLAEGRYVTFDIETTGGNPERNGITEICAIRYENDEPKETWYSMVNPKVPIPPIVRKMTGITNQMVQDEPPIEDVMPGFIEFIGNDILVSHNTVGDLKFLTYFAQTAASHHLSNFFLCTHLLTEKLFPEAPDKSLNGLCKWLELPLQDEHHRAEADALATLELFRALLQKLTFFPHIQTIQDAIRLQGDFESSIRLGWGLNEDELQDTPASMGCFELRNDKKDLVYFSVAQNLKGEIQNLKRHVDLPKQLARQVLSATQFQATVTENFVEALRLEAQLYKKASFKYTPHQRHGRWVHTLAFSEVAKTGDLKVHIGHAPHEAIAVFGPVHDTKECHIWLQGFIDTMGLPQSHRKGTIIPCEHKDLFLSWVRQTLPENLAELKRQRFSWKYLTNSTYRKQLQEDTLQLQKCCDIKAPQKFSELSHETGFLWLHRKKQKWVYPIYQGTISDAITWEGSWEKWLKSDQYQNVLNTWSTTPPSKTLDTPALTSWFTWSKRSEKEGIRYIRHSL